MKSFTILFFLFVSFILNAQDITGDWHGKLSVNGQELRIVLHISKNGEGYTSTLDSPDQGATGIPASETTFDGNALAVKIEVLSATYTAELQDKRLEGVFEQGPNNFPLTMGRKSLEQTKVKRPQEPKGKPRYEQVDVTFKNDTAGIILSGTLTIPKGKGPFPVAILVSGSGPQDRNEEILGHKPFLVIADYLTKKGIAVLRYDDRGVGQSEGKFSEATSLDFSGDALAAVQYLKNQTHFTASRIGIIGHSEGGLIAPMVASVSEDVDFIITLAGPGVPGIDILIEQQELIARAEGVSEKEIEDNRFINKIVLDYVTKHPGGDQLNADVTNLMDSLLTLRQVQLPAGVSRKDFVARETQSITTPWMRYFLKFDPRTVLQKVTCPVLALNGEKDLQVSAEQNLPAIKKAVESNGNKHVTIVRFEDLNHLFQHTKTGAPSEYAKIEETISKGILKYMRKWILELKDYE